MLPAVEGAIRESGLGLNPVSDGHTLKVPLPKLTAEHRQSLVKNASKLVEQSKVTIRNARHDALGKAKGFDKAEGKDELKRLEKKACVCAWSFSLTSAAPNPYRFVRCEGGRFAETEGEGNFELKIGNGPAPLVDLRLSSALHRIEAA